MSGWWLASSAASATALTNFIAPAKSSNFHSRTISSPSRPHWLPSSRWATSSSLSSAIPFPPVRIVSLVPSATETLFALGLGDEVIAVTHECDWPEQTAELPRITRDALPPGLSAGEIDAAVRERTERGESIYALETELLEELEPDLIVTQALCAVCAVSYDDVRAIAEEIDSQPLVISLDPSTMGEVLGDIRTLAEATGRREE